MPALIKENQKSGYLHTDFHIFHLKNLPAQEIPYHYHDFHKLLIPLEGSLGYGVEGRIYDLQTGDCILIPAGQLHRPLYHPASFCRRLIIYISDSYFLACRQKGCDLFTCFSQVQEQQSNLIRLPESLRSSFLSTARELADSFLTDEFGTALYQELKFTELLLQLNRILLAETDACRGTSTANPTVLAIMDYINTHLTEDLSIDRIAGELYLNRSYIMHLFKEETGGTIGNYITDKRLYLAGQAITRGTSITDACYQSGFRSYTAFYQAYKKRYGRSPKNGRILENI